MLNYLYNLALGKYRGPVAWFCTAMLLPFAFLYGLAVRLISSIQLRNPKRLPCKVISVGNIILGGTGKTALVEYICRFLKQNGKKPGILTRGYAAKSGPKGSQPKDYCLLGDEASMLKDKLPGVPVVVDPDRIKGAGVAVAGYGAEVVVLDDGFQQWRITKDLEIVAIDAARLFGNGRLLPAGILREPLESLKRADIFFLTKTELVSGLDSVNKSLEAVNRRALIVEARYQPEIFLSLNGQGTLPLSSLAGKRVMLFSGIADPASFEKTCSDLGLTVVDRLRYPDHHPYSMRDLDKISAQAALHEADNVITTEKDAARLKGFNTGFLALRIRFELTSNREQFHDRLLRVFSA